MIIWGDWKSKSITTNAGWFTKVVIFLMFWLNVAASETNITEKTVNGTASVSISLAEYLKTKYDKTVRPNIGSGKPTEVFLDIYVESFGNIKEVNMEFPGFMYIRQMWLEDRLADFVKSKVQVLQREHISRLWLPDPYCYNAKKSDLMLPDTEVHSVARIAPNGFVLYSRSTHIVASCEMDLHDFPMDVQHCELTFGSYGHTDRDIVLKWKSPSIKIGNKEMAQFSVGDAILSTEINTFTTGNYTVLTVTFPFKRRMGYYIIQVYIPCVFLVMLSWIVFWMRPDDSASRLTVGITTILTIVFLLGYTNGMLPKVSYVKGMDWYLMVCFTIIFLSLLECIIVDRLWRVEAKKKEDEKKSGKMKKPKTKCSMKNTGGLNCRYVSGVQILRPRKEEIGTQANNEDANRNQWEADEHEEIFHMIKDEYKHLSLDQVRPPFPTEAWAEGNKESAHYDTVVRCFVKRNSCPMNISTKVDKASRVLFPLTFVVYNIAYWVTYYHGIKVLPYRL
ncbi:gamma-aminobutyric acid receptor subunit gamma-4-like isoform X3 [Oculina patagonica]